MEDLALFVQDIQLLASQLAATVVPALLDLLGGAAPAGPAAGPGPAAGSGSLPSELSCAVRVCLEEACASLSGQGQAVAALMCEEVVDK